MNRPRFMLEENGAGKPVPIRVECYMLPPKYKLDKDRRRVVTMTFSVKMNSDLARACDEKIARGFEDCTFHERECVGFVSNSEIEHTDVEFLELRESKAACYRLKNVCIAGLLFKRDKGETYLYFSMEAFVANHKQIENFLASHYGSALLAEFRERVEESPPADGSNSAVDVKTFAEGRKKRGKP